MQHQSQRQGDPWPHPPAPPEGASEDTSTGVSDTSAPSSDALRQPVQPEAYQIAQERGLSDNAELEHRLESEQRVNSGSASERH